MSPGAGGPDTGPARRGAGGPDLGPAQGAGGPDTGPAMERLLRAYRDYYDVRTGDGVPAPFAAEAVFRSHEEQFFLVRAARISEAEANEYLFFAGTDRLDADRIRDLAEAAWREGSSRIVPHKDHRSSDVGLIVLTGSAAPGTLDAVRKIRRYQSWRWGLWGWSHLLVCAGDLSSGSCASNWQGRRLLPHVRRAVIRTGQAGQTGSAGQTGQAGKGENV